MKKLFAILAVLVLFGTYAYAADNADNTFILDVTCPAMAVTGEGANIDLDTYEAPYNGAPATGADVDAVWTLSNWGVDGNFTYTLSVASGSGVSAGITLTHDGGAWAGATAGVSGYDMDADDCNTTATFTLTITNVLVPADTEAGKDYAFTYKLTVLD